MLHVVQVIGSANSLRPESLVGQLVTWVDLDWRIDQFPGHPIDYAKVNTADALLLDLTDIPDWNASALEIVKNISSELSVVVISDHCAKCETLAKFSQGAVGIVGHDSSVEAIHARVENAVYRTLAVRQRQSQSDTVNSRLRSISADELAVLKLIVKGIPSKSIATALNVSARTVDRRRKTLLEKLQANSSEQLAYFVGQVSHLWNDLALT